MSKRSMAVELEGVTAGHGDVRALDGVTAHCVTGAVTALVGPNGSGKSTLLDVIAGLIAPTGGRATTHGKCAYVPQHSAAARTLPMTVRDAVAMGRWAHRARWRRSSEADTAIVSECMRALDVDRLARQQLGELSGGQRQRVLVAQGLAQQADLLLLDEPAAGLDWAAAELIRDVVAEETRRGTTVVQATHDIVEASAAAHCILLDAGRSVAQGPPAEVLDPATVGSVWRISTTADR